eukprot:scaffold65110_cov59-Phaeocystis_antarctica.AAC.2
MPRHPTRCGAPSPESWQLAGWRAAKTPRAAWSRSGGKRRRPSSCTPKGGGGEGGGGPAGGAGGCGGCGGGDGGGDGGGGDGGGGDGGGDGGCDGGGDGGGGDNGGCGGDEGGDGGGEGGDGGGSEGGGDGGAAAQPTATSAIAASPVVALVAAQAPRHLPRSVGHAELAHSGAVHVVVEGHGADAHAKGRAHGTVVGEREEFARVPTGRLGVDVGPRSTHASRGAGARGRRPALPHGKCTCCRFAATRQPAKASGDTVAEIKGRYRQ